MFGVGFKDAVLSTGDFVALAGKTIKTGEAPGAARAALLRAFRGLPGVSGRKRFCQLIDNQLDPDRISFEFVSSRDGA